MEFPVPELRTDWLTGRTVLIAENRANRPNDFADELASAAGQLMNNKTLPTCPFCAGNESRTPASVYEKLNDDGQWQVRVVPNMFAAVEAGVPPLIIPSIAGSPDDSQRVATATGVHEVIIECPTHIDRLSALSIDKLLYVLQAYATRLAHLRGNGQLRYCLVFKNQGPCAGASIAHLHSQIIGLPFVPNSVEAEQRRAAESHSHERLCPYCQIIANEQTANERVVLVRDGFIAFCPFASWQPGEVWLMPTGHEPSLESASSTALERLAGVLHALVGRLESNIPGAAYNLILRTAPWTAGNEAWSHWRIELLPRINAFAGLELATGIHINHLAPEQAAGQLRIDRRSDVRVG
jgi:UDPglucose--hexose-1-phosphate uridylyltransferase